MHKRKKKKKKKKKMIEMLMPVRLRRKWNLNSNLARIVWPRPQGWDDNAI